MKMSVCDVCFNEGKIEKAKYRLIKRGADGFSRVSYDLCDKHKDYFSEKTLTECLNILIPKVHKLK